MRIIWAQTEEGQDRKQSREVLAAGVGLNVGSLSSSDDEVLQGNCASLMAGTHITRPLLKSFFKRSLSSVMLKSVNGASLALTSLDLSRPLMEEFFFDRSLLMSACWCSYLSSRF